MIREEGTSQGRDCEPEGAPRTHFRGLDQPRAAAGSKRPRTSRPRTLTATPLKNLLGLLLLVLLAGSCASAASHYERAESLYLTGEFEAAAHHYRAAQRKDPELPGIEEKIRITEIRLFMRRGDEAVLRLDWTTAENAYEEVRYRDPHNPDLPGRLRDMTLARAEHHFLKGSRLFESGDPFAAVPELEQALAFHPEHLQAKALLDQARIQRREREAHADRRFQEGRTALALGRREEALALFEEALDMDPSHNQARQELAAVHKAIAAELVADGDENFRSRSWEAAIQCYERAAGHDPDHYGLADRIQRAQNEAYAEVVLARGHAAFEQGDWTTAFAAFDEAWQLTESRETFQTRYETSRREYAGDLYSRSQTFESTGRVDDALACLDTIDALYEDYRDVEAFRARLVQRKLDAARFYASGKRSQARSDLVSAHDFFTACANAIVTYKDVQARLEFVGESLEEAERLYHRGYTAEGLRDYDRARVFYEECLRIARPYRDTAQRLAALPVGAGSGEGGDG